MKVVAQGISVCIIIDNMSWRDRTKGSIFITELITCFQKYSWCYHLMKIFQKVQKSFEIPMAKAQMPTIERVSLTRDFYLFPGNWKWNHRQPSPPLSTPKSTFTCIACIFNIWCFDKRWYLFRLYEPYIFRFSHRQYNFHENGGQVEMKWKELTGFSSFMADVTSILGWWRLLAVTYRQQ